MAKVLKAVDRDANGRPKVSAICFPCVQALGGTARDEVHVATFHEGACEVCEGRGWLASPRNWIWQPHQQDNGNDR